MSSGIPPISSTTSMQQMQKTQSTHSSMTAQPSNIDKAVVQGEIQLAKQLLMEGKSTSYIQTVTGLPIDKIIALEGQI